MIRNTSPAVLTSGDTPPLDSPPGRRCEHHSWDLTPKQAVQLQRQLSAQVRTDLTLQEVERVGGVDVGYLPKSEESIASVAILSYPDLALVESYVARLPTPFPYIPGLLSFREVPVILRALESLKSPPDLIFVDGHGRAHPRRLGIASHLGWWLQAPTIGIGKSRLCGEFSPSPTQKGRRVDLMHKGERIGQVVCTRTAIRPIFVSVGYGLPLEDCIRWTFRVTPRYRLPEPIRQAHRLASNHV